MSEWKKVKLKDCCLSISDGDHLPPPKTNCGIPFITISNIDSTNHIDFSDTLFVPKDYYEKLDPIRKAQENDILYSVVGSFGKPVLIKDNKEFVFQRHIAILRPDNTLADSRFLYYIMLTRDFFMQADSVAVGAAQRTVSLTSLRNMEVSFPNIETQHRIATILSRYDSLIENYQKQIKLLEEAAQRLYKEWFIDLHFPGHENTKIVDGVPEGWKGKSILEVFDFKYGKILPTKDFVEDGPIPVYGASKQIGRYTKANCFEPKVLIGSRGNAGFVHRTIEDETYVTNNSFIVEPCAKYGYLKLPFIFESFKVLDFVAICTGVAQPQLTLNSISSLKYIVPIKDLIVRYCGITTCYFSKIALAYKQIHLLTEARDRLLPKLMSGEIKA